MKTLNDYEHGVTVGAGISEITAHSVLFLDSDGKQIDQTRVKLINDWEDWGEAPYILAFYNEYGLVAIVSAGSYRSCWEAWVDDKETIEDDEVYAAYGFGSEEELRSHVGDVSELEEGYAYQLNSTGTGIVNIGHNVVTQVIIGNV